MILMIYSGRHARQRDCEIRIARRENTKQNTNHTKKVKDNKSATYYFQYILSSLMRNFYFSKKGFTTLEHLCILTKYLSMELWNIFQFGFFPCKCFSEMSHKLSYVRKQNLIISPLTFS